MKYLDEIRHYRNEEERKFCAWLLHKGYGRAAMLYRYDFSDPSVTCDLVIADAEANRPDIMLAWLDKLKNDKWKAGQHHNFCLLLGGQACWLDRIYDLMKIEFRSDRLLYDMFQRYWTAYAAKDHDRTFHRQTLISAVERRTLNLVKRERDIWRAAYKDDHCCNRPNGDYYNTLTNLLIQQWCYFEVIEAGIPQEQC